MRYPQIKKTLPVLLLAICTTLVAAGQSGRSYRDIFPTVGNFKRKAWSFAIGGTYMVPITSQNLEPVETASDSLFELGYAAKGKPGIALQVSRVVAPQNFGFLKWVDGSIGLKQFKGREKATATLLDGNYNSETALSTTSTSTYNSWLLDASLRLGHYFPVADYTVVTNSVGLNLDWRFADSQDYDKTFAAASPAKPADLRLQLHYRLGLAVKLDEKHLMHVSLETPVLSMLPFDEGRSTSLYYHTRYRPVILRVAFMLFDSKKGIDCPSNVKSNGGSKEHLFGKKQRSHPW